MTNDDRELFEMSALSSARRVVEEYGERLRAAGLELTLPALLKHDSAPGLSEITIWVSRESNVVDCIEYFVWQSGRPYASVDEIESWLRRELDGLFGDHQQP